MLGKVCNKTDLKETTTIILKYEKNEYTFTNFNICLKAT